jgi:ketosteroid isomerase-like protein
MSEAADVVMALCDAINADDQERISDLFDPDIVSYGTRGGIDQDRVFRGRQALLDYWTEVGETWESFQIEVERVIEGDDVAVAFWREIARSEHSDVEIETSTASVYRVRDGKIIEQRGYMDRDEALRDAGLEE